MYDGKFPGLDVGGLGVGVGVGVGVGSAAGVLGALVVVVVVVVEEEIGCVPRFPLGPLGALGALGTLGALVALAEAVVNGVDGRGLHLLTICCGSAIATGSGTGTRALSPRCLLGLRRLWGVTSAETETMREKRMKDLTKTIVGAGATSVNG